MVVKQAVVRVPATKAEIESVKIAAAYSKGGNSSSGQKLTTNSCDNTGRHLNQALHFKSR